MTSQSDAAPHPRGRLRYSDAALVRLTREAVAAALVLAGHLGRCMAELLLRMAFVHIGGRGQSGTQRVPGELAATRRFRQVAPHAGGQHRLLDQAGHLPVVQPGDPTFLPRPVTRRKSGPLSACLRRRARLGWSCGFLAKGQLRCVVRLRNRQEQRPGRHVSPMAPP